MLLNIYNVLKFQMSKWQQHNLNTYNRGFCSVPTLTAPWIKTLGVRGEIGRPSIDHLLHITMLGLLTISDCGSPGSLLAWCNQILHHRLQFPLITQSDQWGQFLLDEYTMCTCIVGQLRELILGVCPSVFTGREGGQEQKRTFVNLYLAILLAGEQ